MVGGGSEKGGGVNAAVYHSFSIGIFPIHHTP